MVPLPPLVSAISAITGPLIKDELALLLGVDDEIKLLLERLERIQGIIQEEKRGSASWHCQLRDAMYDVEDIIQECIIKGHNLRNSPSPSCLPSCFFSLKFRHGIGNKIIKVTKRLDNICKDVVLVKDSTSLYTESSCITNSTSILVPPNLVGSKIEEDTEKLVDLMLSIESCQSRIRVYSIIGMPGIGKTTLAQKICNDEKIRACFNCISPIWVYVSKKCSSEVKLLRAVIERAGGNPGLASEKADLEPILMNVVTNKKFFLVLDDVWDWRVWVDLLAKPMQSALHGSIVLVTTRLLDVARGMKSVHCHDVKPLSNEDAWSLLKKMVSDTDDELEEIGMKIVKKCNGLPLAVKTTAGVLVTKENSRSEWLKVLENPCWAVKDLPADVMSAFYVSYEDLQPHLKRCFTYFSLFPEDTELYQSDFVELWVAEGFVKKEEIAEECWREFVHRSLLQSVPKWYNMSGCRIHDSLHALAKHLSLSESVKPRRLHITTEKDVGISQHVSTEKDVGISQHASLRTLISRGVKNYTDDTTKKMKRLRVLDLRKSSIERLATSITTNMIHLRYLNLSETPIGEIPESIRKLQSLQYLILRKCENLHTLPSTITSLRNLRCIDLQRTKIHDFPSGIERLIELTKINGFIASDDNLKELTPLSKLKSLSVYKLERTTTAVSLKTKPKLKRLELHCTPPRSNSRTKESVKKIMEVFEDLCSPVSLETLRIKGYFGDKYPSWMMEMISTTIPNLTRLEIESCDFCSLLPPLGSLKYLDYFVIRGASSVKTIGPDLFRNGAPKLTNLAFENMANWENWYWQSEESSCPIPSLQLLEIKKCAKLTTIPESLLHNVSTLKTVRIEGARSLKELKNLKFVEELVLYDTPNLKSVSDLPALKTMWLKGCRKLKAVDNVDAMQHLHLKDSEMEALPEWLGIAEGVKFEKLQKLYITGKKRLLERLLEHGADWHFIEQVPCVEAHTENETEYIYYTKSPRSFVTNMNTVS